MMKVIKFTTLMASNALIKYNCCKTTIQLVILESLKCIFFCICKVVGFCLLITIVGIGNRTMLTLNTNCRSSRLSSLSYSY